MDGIPSKYARELNDQEFYALSLEDQYQYLEARIIPGKIYNEKGEECARMFNMEGEVILPPLTPIGSEYRDEIEAAIAHLGDCAVLSDEGAHKEFEEEDFVSTEIHIKNPVQSQMMEIDEEEKEGGTATMEVQFQGIELDD